MRLQIKGTAGIALAIAAGVFSANQTAAQELTALTGEYQAHAMPTATAVSAQAGKQGGPSVQSVGLVYHGGPVMTTATTYAINWAPTKLQDGTPVNMPAYYFNLQESLLQMYPGHGIDNNNTQYYMVTTPNPSLGGVEYIQNAGSFGGAYNDNSSYPTGGCSYVYANVKANNCLTDAQIQTEIGRVMTLKGWTGGLNNIFFVYTASGEGVYMGSAGAYEQFCGYHGFFAQGSSTVLYAVIPYAIAGYCQSPKATSPNADPAADSAASIASHELTEAITDPLLNAWFDAAGNEIGDLCAWQYGTNTWGTANQFWPIAISNGQISPPIVTSFELQMQWDNHTSSCVQLGPN